MLRIISAGVLLGSLAMSGPAGPVFEGSIKDIRAAEGVLTLTVGKGKQARDRAFSIQGARIVGLSGAEWKANDLRVGDRVRVEMTRDGKLVQEVRVLQSGEKKPVRPGRTKPGKAP
jgi:hypothetical protein